MPSSKRMRRGDGSIVLREDGRWMARYMVTLPNGTRKRQTIYGASSEEARSKMRKEQADAANGSPVCRNGLTVANHLTAWVKVAPRIRASTKSGYEGVIRRHIIPAIGNVRLASLTTMRIQQVVNDYIDKGGSIRNAQIIRAVLSSSLRYAKQHGLVSQNVARGVELPTYEPPEKKIWTKQQASEFLEVIKTNKYRFLFEIYLTYGTRRGEALAIEWEDIDFDKNTIHIVKQYTYMGRELEVCEPKTKNSKRYLPLLPHIEATLQDLYPANPTGAIVKENGKMVTPSAIEREFKKIINKHGLPDVTLHSLRHFTATFLKAANVSIKDAQMILGHSSPITTMQHYQHSSLEDKETALKRYAETMAF